MMPALLGFMHSWIFLALTYLYVLAGPVSALASLLLAGAVLGGLPIALAEVTVLIWMSRRF